MKRCVCGKSIYLEKYIYCVYIEIEKSHHIINGGSLLCNLIHKSRDILIVPVHYFSVPEIQE